MSHLDLPPLPPSVTVDDSGGGPPVLRVAIDRATAEVHLHGGQVTSWVPAGHDPVLWTSPLARFGTGEAIRGGIPICFPWFGAGREDPAMQPAHGFARLTPFRLTDVAEADGEVTVTLQLSDRDVIEAPGRDRWPHGFELTCAVTVGTTLRLRLTTLNRSDRVVSHEEALHAYLAVRDVREVTLTGLDGAPYVDKTTSPWSARDQHGDVRLDRATDRVYGTRAAVTVHDPGLDRRIHVTREGSASSVVWNPWESGTPGDVAEHWSEFVCVETANVLHDGVVLSPGESHTAVSTYAVEHGAA